MGKKKGKKKGKKEEKPKTDFDDLPLLELETTTVPGKKAELKAVSNTRNLHCKCSTCSCNSMEAL